MSNPFYASRPATGNAEAQPQSDFGLEESMNNFPTAEEVAESLATPRPPPRTKKVSFTTPPGSPPSDPNIAQQYLINGLSQGDVTALRHSLDSIQLPPTDARLPNAEFGGSQLPYTDRANLFGMSNGEVLSPITNAPVTSFGRTLADMEDPSNGKSKPGPSSGEQEDELANRPAQRAAMDVDAFKNMLLTGKAPQRRDSAEKSMPAYLAQEDDSSEDSDDSLPAPRRPTSQQQQDELYGTSPGTIQGGSLSERVAQSTNEADAPKSSKPKPPPPRHRHGKAVGPAATTGRPVGPQIVSFDDFAPSLPTGTPTVSSPPPTLPRRMSGTPKPLPPTPQPASPAVQPADRPESAEPPPTRPPLPSSSSSTSAVLSTSSRRPPPTVPLARRQSQRSTNSATTSTRSRSGTMSSLNPPDEEDSDDTPSAHPSTRPDVSSPGPGLGISTGAGSKMAPPPPPPTRRSIPTSHSPDPPTTSAPPAGPAAAPTNTGLTSPSSTSLHRTLQQQHQPPHRTRSASQTSLPSSTLGTPTPAPPPPPPPRRTSSRSSIDAPRPAPSQLLQSPGAAGVGQPGSRRTSAEMRRSGEYERRGSFLAGTRGGSISEVLEEQDVVSTGTGMGMGKEAEAGAGKKDILADMDAFQKEIDELLRRNSADVGGR